MKKYRIIYLVNTFNYSKHYTKILNTNSHEHIYVHITNSTIYTMINNYFLEGSITH